MFECKPTAVSQFLFCIFVTFAFGVVSGSGQCLKPGLNSAKFIFLPFQSHELSTADANSDGKPDLTYQVTGSDKLSIRFGDGTGGFGAPNTYTVGSAQSINNFRVIFADLTGDGKPEMLIDNQSTIAVWLNNGTGSFAFSNSKNHQSFLSAVVDLNGDGKGDFVSILSSIPGGSSTSFRVEFGNGSGGFAAPVDYFTPGNGLGYYLFVGDFDANGRPDVVVGRTDPGITPKLFINDGSGGLVEVSAPSIPAMTVTGVADLNNDGKSDLFGQAQNGTSNFLVLINNGANVYTTKSYAGFNMAGSEPHQVVDFDGNGTKDIAVHIFSSQGASNDLLLNDGNGNLTRFVFLKPDLGELNGDFNLDGKTDFISLANNVLTEEVVATVRTPTCARRGDPIKVDYNGDGFSEYAVWRPSTSTWFMRTVLGGTNSSVQFGTSGDVPVPGDFDGDGITDFAIFRPSLGDWWILRSSDQTVFSLHFGATGDKPTPGDYDGDGISDIAVYRPSNGGWY
ncbi:MAG: VCBS repeat-containing protein, partial [Pyrinomonadaceae bacterium]